MHYRYAGSLRLAAVCFIMTMFLCGGMVGECLAQPRDDVMKAFYLRDVPTSYAGADGLFASLQDTGANTVIIELPLTPQGLPDVNTIPNVVYLAHKAGLKVAVILPVRQLPGVLALHRDWEDLRYDLGRGSTVRSGMLDLFRTDAVLYLADLVKKLVFYSVDTVLFGQDFAYGPGDGMSDVALARARDLIGEPVQAKKIFTRHSRGAEGAPVEEYGDQFWKWAEVKRDRLLRVYDILTAAGRSVKGTTMFGIPAPVILPVPLEREVLARYSYDMGAFQKRNVDYYWTRIATRSMKERGNLMSRQITELVSRTASSTATTVKEAEKRVVVLDAASLDGKFLPLSEIEEVSELVINSGKCGIAYAVAPDTVVPKDFMQKLFGRRT